MFRSMFLFWCAFLWCTNCYASDISYLDRGSILEKDIAAIFNKVAYGGVTTTKRSISSKYPPVSGGTPTTIPPPLTSILIPTTTPVTSNTPKTNPEQKTDNANKTEKKDLTVRNQNTQAYTTNLPPYLAPKTSFPIAYTTPSSRGEVPSYVPPLRSFFTPPLPPEYANPFADKPTLRGSNSDGTLGPGGRRPVPPPRQEQEVYGRERIPLRPPDLGPDINVGSPSQDRKKPLNTPSFNRSPGSPDAPGYDPVEHETPSAKPQNDTDFDFVPILHYPSVSRILSGSNGRKDFPDIHKPHVESRLPKMPEHYPKIDLESPGPRPALGPAAGGKSNGGGILPVRPVPKLVATPEDERPPPPARDPAAKGVDYDTRPADKDEKSIGIPDSLDIESKLDSASDRAERLPSPEPQPPKVSDSDASINLSNKNLEYKPSRKDTDSSWLLAWDIHVYLVATLFLVLAVSSLVNLLRINSYKRLLGHGYYIAVHSFLLIVGTLRSFYLFLDAYNVKGTLPRPFSDLVLNVVSPLITSTFITLFLFVLKASKADVVSTRFQRPFGVAIFIVFHVFLVVAFELTSEIRPQLQILPLVGQCVYIIVLVVLGVAYLYVYKVLAGSVARKSENIFGGNFTAVYKPTIAVTIRAMLAVALLALLMAAIQLYGVFGVLESWKHDASGGGGRNLQWLWWGYQFSVRLVEAAACFLMLWAGIQSLRCHAGGGNNPDDEKNSDNSGFALFRCGQCTASTQGDASDDIYPAVCVTNQAIHDYTLRTGKKVYDDSFPLNSLHSQMHPGVHGGVQLSSGMLQQQRDGSSPNSVHYEDPGNLGAGSDRRSLRRGYQSQDAYAAGSRALAPNNYACYEERGVGATDCGGGYQQGRFNYEDSNFSTNERRSSKKVSPSFDSDDFVNAAIGEGARGKSGSYLDVNQRAYKAAAAAEKRAAAMKKSGTFDGAVDERAGGVPTKSATTERRSAKARAAMAAACGGDPRGSLKKAGTLQTAERRVLNQHRGGAQTLNARGASPNASMLVAENGFVRFRALQEPEEVDSDECLMER